MRADANSPPSDLASVDFFPFVQSNAGKDLYDMLSIFDQPSEALWNHYANWWSSNKIGFEDKYNPRGTLNTFWIRYVQWTSKTFMTAFNDLTLKLTMNPSMINGEELLWQTTLMKNLILDLKLATKLDAKNPSTWFQKMIALRKYKLKNRFTTCKTKSDTFDSADEILKCKGNLAVICKRIFSLLPDIKRPVQFQLIEEERLKFFKKHNINQLWTKNGLIVPEMVNLDRHYRIAFEVDGNHFNKKVEQELKEPQEDDLFGQDSESEEEVEEVPPPKKKKKVLFSSF